VSEFDLVEYSLNLVKLISAGVFLAFLQSIVKTHQITPIENIAV
jgi:hypothetical protein